MCRGEDETAVAVVAGDTGPPPTEAAAALQTAPLVSRIDDARARAAEAAIVAAVIGSIARDPGFVSAIVSAAVAETPVHREAIVSRASAAFPGFAVQIAQAAAQERRVPH